MRERDGRIVPQIDELTNDDAGDAAAEACQSLTDPWQAATENGLHHDAMRHASARLLEIAATTLDASMPTLANTCRSWRTTNMLSPSQPRSVNELLKSSTETKTAPSRQHSRPGRSCRKSCRG